MKFALAFFLCSSIADTCLPPYVFDLQFDTEYDCLIKGYEESLDKIIQIGPKDVNTHSMYIKFGCYPVSTETNT